MTITSHLKNWLVAAAVLAFAGCNGNSATTAPSSSAAAGHEHEHEGPHGGHIIELGSEEYHAEITHDDDTHTVGIYVLDSEAKGSVAIGAASATINVVANGQPAQYTLAAAPQTDDQDGNSSYFEIVNEELCESLDDSEAKARLNILIDNTPYTGEIETHEHDHEDHDHADA
jgi:hypothetical protein